MPQRVVVVSENAKTRETLAQAVRARGWKPTLAGSADEAQRVLETVDAAMVLVETRRVDVRTHRLCARLAEIRPGCRVVPLTSFVAVRKTPDLLQFDSDDFLIDAASLLQTLEPSSFASEASRSACEDRGVDALVQTVDVLVGLLELGDPHFRGSSHLVTRLARGVADELAISRELVQEVVLASLLKDIGKAAIDPAVAPSDQDLDEAQKEALKEHAPAGARLLEHITFPWNVLPAIRHHHERYDGRGYPDGLKGREIPMGARIVAVVDAYVAMGSARPYRPALHPEEAVDELERQAGQQFDPEVVEALIRVLEKTPAVIGGGGKPSVLVCDGDAEFRKVLEMRLANEGYDVNCVTKADEALDVIVNAPPDLILADVAADGSDAFQLLRELRKDATFQDIPFAFLARAESRLLKIRALRQAWTTSSSKRTTWKAARARSEHLTRESARRGGTQARGGVGQLENLGIRHRPTLAIGMKTALVAVSQGQSGKIWLRRRGGYMCGSFPAKRRSAKLARFKTGEFAIEHGIKSRRTTIECDTMFLVMESMRLMDELGAK
jgi:response regulator RpfG family c-di-GMP phosphodiesterase